MRDLLRAEAARGSAVLVSSHLLSEVAQSVDDVVVIAHGALRASGPLEEVLGGADGPGHAGARGRGRPAGRRPRRAGVTASSRRAGALVARGTTPERVGAVAADHGLALIELVAVSRSLEDAFFELTADAA